MKEEVKNYIKSQIIGVIAVEMLDGSPHAATVHYAFGDSPEAIYIMTGRQHRKCESIVKNGKTRASFVVGTSESQMKTLQMDGEVMFATSDVDKEVYFAKFPDRKEKYQEPKGVILKFTPSWWQYIDMKSANGKLVISSEEAGK